jgi:hypothetical protein
MVDRLAHAEEPALVSSGTRTHVDRSDALRRFGDDDRAGARSIDRPALIVLLDLPVLRVADSWRRSLAWGVAIVSETATLVKSYSSISATKFRAVRNNGGYARLERARHHCLAGRKEIAISVWRRCAEKVSTSG